MEAAPARSTVLDPAGTEMDGLEGKVMVTPLKVQAPLDAVIVPPDEIEIDVSSTPKLFVLRTRRTTSLEPPGRSDAVGPPVRATTLTAARVPVVPEPDPLPCEFHLANATPPVPPITKPTNAMMVHSRRESRKCETAISVCTSFWVLAR